MTFRLTQLSVENFRSIRGRFTVDLDAPIVLIHGPNGIGKTSLLSAIELGLTGDVAALSRGEPGFMQYLVHKDSPNQTGRVELTVLSNQIVEATHLQLTGAGIEGGPLLGAEAAEFFSNRCYLAQSTLGRLFEIYQRQDARRSDTALTKFVKDLLRLDSLDALIDGLHPVGNVSRLRGPAPLFYSARSNLPGLEGDTAAAENDTKRLEAELAAIVADIRNLTADVFAPDQPIDTDLLDENLRARLQADELWLTDLVSKRREVEVIRSQIAEYAISVEGSQRAALERALAVAKAAMAAWVERDGARLRMVLQEVQTKHSDIPPIENGARPAWSAAQSTVAAEIRRLNGVISQDSDNQHALNAVEADIVQGQARLGQIDRELSGLVGTNQSLANALAALALHIHSDDCPVCGRDFSEVSGQPLAAALSARIASLSETASRLEALSRDRSATQGLISAARRRGDELRALRLTNEALTALKMDLAQLEEWNIELAALASAADQGTATQSALAQAELDLARLTTQSATLSGHRLQLTTLAEALQLAPLEPAESIQAAIGRLIAEIGSRSTAISERRDRLRLAEDKTRQLVSRQIELVVAQARAQSQRQRFEAVSDAKAEADRRIDVARALAADARMKRTAIVSQVFNSDLNTVWRDLFIRLAPEESFIPRFKLPSAAGGPVEAELETIYRTGGIGGDPRSMLSAGNLNTAALTLFLALHLSVPANLPLLIIDDPVQSMDEVHIAQFAALLRTLKGADRQVVIAVHERALFDYLALELSPAFIGDRLITIDLTRAVGGDTRPIWDLKSYKVDQAVAA